MENAIEAQLASRSITYRRTGRAERVEGFEQVPDFFVPTVFAPAVRSRPRLPSGPKGAMQPDSQGPPAGRDYATGIRRRFRRTSTS